MTTTDGVPRARVKMAALLAALLATTTAQAQSQVSTFDIPAQGLSSALLALGAQARITVVAPTDLVGDRKAPSLAGSFSHEEALRRLLQGSGYEFSFVDPKSVVVRAAPRGSGLGLPPLQQGRAAVKPLQGPVEDLYVVSSRLQAKGDGASPVVSLNRSQIESSGVESLAQLMNNLPQVSVKSTTSAYQSGRGFSTVRLRGLPAGTTLFMLDGRRLSGTAYQGGSNFNLNMLPLAAIERVEVLPGGSSAVYGGDALAGVINMVLRKNLDGGSVDVRYGHADHFNERQVSASWGTGFERGTFNILAEYDSSNKLTAAHRSLTADSDYRAEGGGLATSELTSPGNIYSLNGQPLPGLGGATSAGIPAGLTGVGLTTASFLATAGRPNTSTTFYSAAPMVPRTKQYGGMAYGTFELTDGIELYANALYSHRVGEESDYPNYISGGVLGANNPYNPFGVAVGLNYVYKGGGEWCYCATQEYKRGVVGARGDIGDWHWDTALALTRSTDIFRTATTLLNPEATAAALLSSNPATAFNPFADRTWTRAQLDPYWGGTVQKSTAPLTTLDVSLRGPVYQLPSGDITLAIGAEYSYNSMDLNDYMTSVQAQRRVASGFTELRVPLVGPGEEGGPERVVLSGAVRRDWYSDAGGKTSPQAGLEVRPAAGILLRGSFAAAFKPPTLAHLNTPRISYAGQVITDPRRKESYGVNYFEGGNPDLKPMTGTTQSIGFVLTPAFAPGLEITASKWAAKLKNYANLISSTTLIANESLFPDYVVRGAPTAADVAAGLPGRINTLNVIRLNFGTFNLAGVDVSARWPFQTSFGQLVPQVAVSNTYRYNTALIPGAPVRQYAGAASSTGFAPKWKSQASLGWNTEWVETLVTGNYIGAYRDYAPSSNRIGNFWTFDTNVRIAVGHAFNDAPGKLKDSYVTIGVRNLFDKLPVYSAYSDSVAYDPAQYDIVGRYGYVQLSLRF